MAASRGVQKESQDALVRIFESKHSFVKAKLGAGKVPTSAMLATFLRELVDEIRPHVKNAAPTVEIGARSFADHASYQITPISISVTASRPSTWGCSHVLPFSL